MNKFNKAVLSVLLIVAGLFVCLYSIWLSMGILRFFGSFMELGSEIIRDVPLETFGDFLFYAWAIVIVFGGLILIGVWVILISCSVFYPICRVWRAIWKKSKK